MIVVGNYSTTQGIKTLTPHGTTWGRDAIGGTVLGGREGEAFPSGVVSAKDLALNSEEDSEADESDAVDEERFHS